MKQEMQKPWKEYHFWIPSLPLQRLLKRKFTNYICHNLAYDVLHSHIYILLMMSLSTYKPCVYSLKIKINLRHWICAAFFVLIPCRRFKLFGYYYNIQIWIEVILSSTIFFIIFLLQIVQALIYETVSY